MKDLASRADLESVIHSFYQKALTDEAIGYIFTDVAHLDLKEHLPRIIDFWESVLFGVGKYQGNPVIKHVHLHQLSALTQAHFDRWISIWNASLIHSFKGPKTDEAIAKAKMMGDLMMYKIKASEEKGFIESFI